MMSSAYNVFRPFTVLAKRGKCSHSLHRVFSPHNCRPSSSTLVPLPCFQLETTWNDFNRQSNTRCFSSTAHASTSSSSPQSTFSSFIPPLHPATLHALTHKLRHVHPTEIQTQSYAAAITGRDVLARARTGTGKTLAFLLPALENALTGLSADLRGRKNPVAILVVCPTRELAIQIHSTAQLIAASHSNSAEGIRMTTQVMYGGVSKEKDVQKLEEKLPFVLVATPGRLLDHMENTIVAGERFGLILGNISVLVLDEVSTQNGKRGFTLH